jgi:hypothetical protein
MGVEPKLINRCFQFLVVLTINDWRAIYVPKLLQHDIYRSIVLAWHTFLALLLALLTRAVFFARLVGSTGDREVFQNIQGVARSGWSRG